MQKAKKEARPPPDDPVQSERFMKDAAEFMVADGAQAFERAMEVLVQSSQLPVKTATSIMKPATAAKKKAAKTIKKSGSSR